jgi:hypothetical protein
MDGDEKPEGGIDSVVMISVNQYFETDMAIHYSKKCVPFMLVEFE